uniref:Uncharacterized protein n=1 Tax=Leersia perrieri TaxID=77586 RepID=A0A0D9WZM3_9ORYZ
MEEEFPSLFSFTQNEDISVFSILEAEHMDEIFNLPLSMGAYQELIAWQEVRNNHIFKGINATLHIWKRNFKEDIALLWHRVKHTNQASFQLWIDSL